MTKRTSTPSIATALLVGAMCATTVLASDEPQIKPGGTIVVLNDTHVQAGEEKLASVDKGTELVATEVNGEWIAVTVERAGKTISGWIHTEELIANPKTAFMKLTVRFESKIAQAEKDFKRIDKNADGTLILDEFVAGARKPTLDDLNRRLRSAASGGPTLRGLTDFMEAIAAFEGWKGPVTQKQFLQLQDEFLQTRDIRRSRLARQLIDSEDPSVRAKRAEALSKWADKNRDEKLSLDEFKQALPEKERERAQQRRGDPNNAGKKSRAKRETRKKSKKRGQRNKS